ncbi:MAG: LysR family transcriptional regulator [Rhizomicrobium sp.]
METRYLETLLTVFETSSLAETARRHNLTPSTVAQRIRALEQEIGQKLIARAGHAVKPTAAGSAIMAEARRMIAVESDLKAAASAKLGVGLLRVGVIQTALSSLMPDVLIGLKKRHPGLEAYLIPGVSVDLYNALLAGELDLAVLIRPHFAVPKSLEWLLLREEHMVLLTPKTLKGVDTDNILKTEAFIRYDRNHWGGRIVDQYLRRKKIHPKEQFELDSLEAITVLVGRGLGVAIIPQLPPPWPYGADVRKLSLADAPLRKVGILWPKGSTRLPLIKNFVAEFRARPDSQHLRQ